MMKAEEAARAHNYGTCVVQVVLNECLVLYLLGATYTFLYCKECPVPDSLQSSLL